MQQNINYSFQRKKLRRLHSIKINKGGNTRFYYSHIPNILNKNESESQENNKINANIYLKAN